MQLDPAIALLTYKAQLSNKGYRLDREDGKYILIKHNSKKSQELTGRTLHEALAEALDIV